MEASVVEAPPITEPPAALPPDGQEEAIEAAADASLPSTPIAASATQAKMFKYSTYLHVGDGAKECEHATDGECADVDHFHAWCRLPNKFQHKDIYDRASAAKARRIRQLNDASSDARAILEDELEALQGQEDDYVETIIDDLLKEEWAQDFFLAMKDIGEREEYEHINIDRERFNELDKIEGERSEEDWTEEFKELTRHVGEWREKVAAQLTVIQEPKRVSFRELDRGQLFDLMRSKRVKQLGVEHYMHTYNQWEWFICTLKVTPHSTLKRPYERYWAEMGSLDKQEPGSMWGESPEVIEALQATYDTLERALQSGVSGNS